MHATSYRLDVLVMLGMFAAPLLPLALFVFVMVIAPSPLYVAGIVLVLIVLLANLLAPYRIDVAADDAITFKAVLRSRTVGAKTIDSVIRTQGYPWVVIRWHGGKIRMHRSLQGWHAFLAQLRKVNPGVEISGL